LLPLRRFVNRAHRLVFTTLVLSICSILVLASSASHPRSVSADNDGHDHQAAGFVYVNDNTAASNTVEGFARASDGSLKALDGSPFNVGGAGLGTSGLGSQGGAELSADGNFLFVVDAGSNQISVLRVREDGGLDTVSGSPFSSNGIRPVSVAVQDETVFVANAGDPTASTNSCTLTGGGSNYTGFRLDGGGRLTPLNNSTYCVPPGSNLGDVLISRDGRHVVGIRVGAKPPTQASPSLIDSFDLDDHGELTVSPGSPFAAQVAGPFGSSFRPTNSSQVFVSDAHGPSGFVSAYTVAANATLTPISGSPFADNQAAPCWLVVSQDGKYVYALNTASQTISSYSIAQDGTLTLIGSTLQTGGKGPNAPTDTAIDPSGRAIYSLQAGAAAVVGFTAQNGNVTALASTFSLPSDPSHPAGIAVK
jgi:6-phosphogluconolactonase